MKVDIAIKETKDHAGELEGIDDINSPEDEEWARIINEKFVHSEKIVTLRLKGGSGSGNFGHGGRPGEVGGSSTGGGSYTDGSKESLTEYLNLVSGINQISTEGIVLKHGKFYTPQPLPKGYKRAKSKECFKNAYELSQREGLTYVEGYAVPDFIDLPIHHAWVVDKAGNVIDNTWKTPGSVYFGISFDNEFVMSVIVETETYGVMDFGSSTFVEKYAPGIRVRRKELIIRLKGGKGSGNFGHAGRKGEVGGSAPSGAFAGKMANPNGIDTMSQYQNVDGTWTPERQALHDKIKAKFFYGRTPVKDPVSYIMGGGPASGKSTLVNSGLVDLPENMVLAAGDDIKSLLPEYNGSNAPFVHEESSYLSKEIAKEAANNGYNLLLDGTGDSGIRALTDKVATMRSSGQKVHGIYVTVDIKTAVERSVSRAKATGRYMPESVLRANHKAVSSIFPDIIKSGILDSMKLFSTSGGTPTMIASAEGADLTIHDSQGYQAFLDKANE